MIFGAEPLVFYATDLGTKLVDARVGSRLVGANKLLDYAAHIIIVNLLALGCQLAKDEGVRNHVADSMVSIRKVVQWTLFVNDPDSSFLSPDDNTLDITGTLAHLLEFAVQDVSSLDGSLSVEFSRVRDLEENILHNVLSVWALELEWTTLEEHIIESPSLGGQDGWETHLTLLNEKGEIDGTRACVTSGPGFTRASVGCMAIGT
jgi:hypothetical protein